MTRYMIKKVHHTSKMLFISSMQLIGNLQKQNNNNTFPQQES